MKRGIDKVDTQQRITKSLVELLQEVNVGDYKDFQAYLKQEKSLVLSLNGGLAKNLNLAHLGQALKGSKMIRILNLNNNDLNEDDIAALDLKNTKVFALNLMNNNIRNNGAAIVCKNLKNTKVTHINLTKNSIGRLANDLAKLGQSLKDTPVTNLNLSDNLIGSREAAALCENLMDTNVSKLDLSHNYIHSNEAAEFGASLKDTNVTDLKLEDNIICTNGAAELIKNLKGSKVSSLSLNNIQEAILATVIPGTPLEFIETGNSKSPFLLNEALRKNRWLLQLQPYYTACLEHIPHDKKQQYYGLEKLTAKSTPAEQLKFAGGIFMGLGDYGHQDLQHLILSHLVPGKDLIIANQYQVAAANKAAHIKTQQNANSMDVENRDMDVENQPISSRLRSRYKG